MPDIKVVLGDFTFQNMEVPSKIPFSGEQILAIQKFVGGGRNVDAMGFDPTPLEWSGLFFGVGALARAKYLHNLCRKGKELRLQWSEFDFTVVINKIHCDFELVHKIPYSITCEIVADNLVPLDVLRVVADFDSIIYEDVAIIIDAGDKLVETEDNSGITDATIPESTISKITALKNTINSVNKFMKATVKQINTVKAQVKDLQDQVTRQIASASNFLQTVTTLGGVLPNNPISRSADNLSRTVRNVNNSIQLMNIKYTLTNIGKNLDTLHPNSGTVTTMKGRDQLFSLPTTQIVQNASLYDLAAMYYGNAMKWTLIAKENGLKSPYVTESMTLRIPRDENSVGGNLDV